LLPEPNKEMLDKIDFLTAPSTIACNPSLAHGDDDDDLSIDGDGFPSLLVSPGKKSKRALVQRNTDESHLSLDSNGFPSILKKVISYEPQLPLLDTLGFAMKKPATVMKKPAAMKVTKFHKKQDGKAKAPLSMKERLNLKPTGCSKCRGIPGCTPSCWKGRGLNVKM
jgi:hypothetical protein